MGKAIVIGIVVIVAILAGVWLLWYFRWKDSKDKARQHGWATHGDLNGRQEKALIEDNNSMAAFVRHLLAPPSNLRGDMTILSQEDRQRAEILLRSHDSHEKFTDLITKGSRYS